MKYLHTMVRVTDLDASLKFYCDALGLREVNRREVPQGRFTLVFSPRPATRARRSSSRYNWDPEAYSGGRNFGHLAYAVDDIYAACQRLKDHGVTINRPPRDGHMAFVRSPDNISIELLQKGGRCRPRSRARKSIRRAVVSGAPGRVQHARLRGIAAMLVAVAALACMDTLLKIAHGALPDDAGERDARIRVAAVHPAAGAVHAAASPI